MRIQTPQLSSNDEKREGSQKSAARTNSQVSAIKGFSAVQFLSSKVLPLNELLQLCIQSGNETHWTEFVNRSHPIIAGVIIKTICHWIRPEPSLVDDMVQETYLRLCLNDFRALRHFVVRHENSVFGFLKVVASNTVRDHFRGVNSRKRGSGVTDILLDCGSLAQPTDPPLVAERRVLVQRVYDCLEAYVNGPNSVRDRMIFWLYYKNGMTAKAISGIPSISLSVKGVESTIWRLVHLCRVKLNSQVENDAQQRFTESN
jgi:DNA-directed RNA polymerase specialized sigma24 family protein